MIYIHMLNELKRISQFIYIFFYFYQFICAIQVTKTLDFCQKHLFGGNIALGNQKCIFCTNLCMTDNWVIW